MTTRKVTKVQFSDGTSIDGNRIQTFVDNLEERINNIPTGDIKTRYMEQQIVAGWQVASGSATAAPSVPYAYHDILTNFCPWTRVSNKFVQKTAAQQDFEPSDPNVINDYRVKGLTNPSIANDYNEVNFNAAVQRTSATQYCWTQAFNVGDQPAILDSLAFFVYRDPQMGPAAASYGDEFKNTVVPTGAPPSYGIGQYLQDIHVVVDIDSPFNSENKTYNDVEVTRHEFSSLGQLFTSFQFPTDAALTPFQANMLPYHPHPVRGLAINLRNVNIPLHENARVRVRLVIPNYGIDSAGNPRQEPWGNNPLSTFSWGSCITLLEEITNG